MSNMGFHAALHTGTAGARVGTLERARPLLGRAIAGEDQVEHRYVTLQSPSGIDEVEHPSEVLRTRSRWDQGIGDLWDEQLDKDVALDALYRKAFDEVLGLERYIEPGDATPDAKESAELSRWALSKIDSLETIYRHWLGAEPRGLATVETIVRRITTGEWRGALVPVDLIDRPMRRIAFDRKTHGLYIRRPEGKFIKAPYGKMITWRRGTKDNPWGKAQCDKTYWLSEFTLQGWVFWNLFIERRADPTPYVGYPSRHDTQWNEEQQQLARQVLEAIRDGKGAYGPETLAPKFLESAISASVSYEKFIAALNQLKAIFVLSDMQIADMDGRSGAYNSKSVGAERFLSRVSLLVRDFSAFLKDHLLLPIHLYNYGPHVAAPKFRMDLGEGEERAIRREGLALAKEHGLLVPEPWVYQVVGAPKVQEGEQPFDWNATEPDEEPDDLDDPEAEPEQDPPVPDPEPDDDPDDEDLADHRPTLDLSEAASPQTRTRHRSLDEVSAAFRPAFVEHFARQQADIADAWDRGDLAHGVEALGEIFTGERARELGQILHAAVAHGAGAAMAELLADGLPARLWRITVPTDRPVDLAMGGEAPVVALSEAGDAAREAATWTSAVDWWADRLAISKDAFHELEESARRTAFTLAGVEDLRLLADVHQLIGEALAEGLDRVAFRARLAELYRARGLDPTSDWHADLVLNNNIRQAHAWTRWLQTVGNSASHGVVPYLRWVTLADDKVRDRPRHHHRVMHGRVFAVAHEIWSTWWYPAGHGCRCAVELVTRAEAQRLGYTGSEPTGPWPTNPHDAGRRALPDPGFSGIGRPNPAMAAETLEGLLDALAGRGADSSPDSGSPAGTLTTIAHNLLQTLLGLALLQFLGLFFGDDE